MNGPEPYCRSCGRGDLRNVLSLGQMPLANSLVSREKLDTAEGVFPLELAFCPTCTLVQITETVSPEELFGEYLYFSSFSNTMLEHAEDLADHLIETRALNSESLVVEIGSNDGYLLQYFVARGVPVLGIEPATNIVQIAEQKGVRSLCGFFGAELAQRLKERGQRADVIIANNVLAHVADLNGFVEGLEALIKNDGLIVVEVPYLVDLIDHCEFDTIYHEHLCYFSVTSLKRLLRRHGLELISVEKIATHGGSLRLFVMREDQAKSDETVTALLNDEAEWGVNSVESYESFEDAVVQMKASIRTMLNTISRDGGRIAAYGAAAKATVLLNYCEIGREVVEFVVDRSPHKQGRYVPGVRIPIVAPSRLLEEMPEYTLLLAWNLAEEVLDQEAKYRQRGGKFIIPLPSVRIV